MAPNKKAKGKNGSLKKSQSLHSLAAKGQLNLISEHLAHLDDRDAESGWTPLHRALYSGNLKAAMTLIDARCSTRLRDREQNTPFELLATLIPLMRFEPSRIPCASSLYTWGSNSNLLLGHSDGGAKAQPDRLDIIVKGKKADVADVVVGKFHTVAVTRCGAVFTWGFGRDGRLGHEADDSSVTPRQVTALAEFKCIKIAASHDHTLVLTSNGRVYGFGSNSHGQLGLDDATEVVKSAKKMIGIENKSIVGLAVGPRQSFVHTTKELFSLGKNDGQLGHKKGDAEIRVPRKVNFYENDQAIIQVVTNEEATVCLLSGGELHVLTDFAHKRVYCNVRRFPKGMFVNQLEEHVVTKLVAESDHEKKFVAVTSVGEVYSWSKQSIPRLVWPLKKPGLRAVSVAFHKEKFFITTDSGHLVSFVEPPESPPFTPFVAPDFQEIPFISRAVKLAIGKGCFAVTTQPFCPPPVAVSESRYNQHVNNIWDFFRTQDICDVAFEFPDGKEILAHKVLLACRCPSLAALFASEPKPHQNLQRHLAYSRINGAGQSVYSVKSWSLPGFKIILQFLCTNVVNQKDADRKVLQEAKEIAASLGVADFTAATQSKTTIQGAHTTIGPKGENHASLAPLLDVKIKLSEGEVMCSRPLLVSRSPYFEAMLGPGCYWMETSQIPCVVSLRHIPSTVFQVLLRYIHSDNTDIFADLNGSPSKKLNFALEVMAAANELLLDHLKETCQLEISRLVDFRNVVEIIEVADFLNATLLKAYCTDFIFANLEYMLETKLLDPLDPLILAQLEAKLRRMARDEHFSDIHLGIHLALTQEDRHEDAAPRKLSRRVRRFLSFGRKTSEGESGSEVSDFSDTSDVSDGDFSGISNSGSESEGVTSESEPESPKMARAAKRGTQLSPTKTTAAAPLSPAQQKAPSSASPILRPVKEGSASFLESPSGGAWFAYDPSGPSAPTKGKQPATLASPPKAIPPKQAPAEFKAPQLSPSKPSWNMTPAGKTPQPQSLVDIISAEKARSQSKPSPQPPAKAAVPTQAQPTAARSPSLDEAWSVKVVPEKSAGKGRAPKVTKPVEPPAVHTSGNPWATLTKSTEKMSLHDIQNEEASKIAPSKPQAPLHTLQATPQKSPQKTTGWAAIPAAKPTQTPSVSFNSILSEQEKEKSRKAATLKKSLVRIQAEEAAKQELELYYQRIAEETGERFVIRQILVEDDKRGRENGS